MTGAINLNIIASRQQSGEDQTGEGPSGVSGRPSMARPSEARVAAIETTPGHLF